MSLELIEALREKIAHLEKMRSHLAYSYEKVSAWWRVDQVFDTWDADRLESLAAFKVRFAELQDHLESAMNLIARIENENVDRFTYVLNYMVKLAILDSMEEWLAIRDLRNAAPTTIQPRRLRKPCIFTACSKTRITSFKPSIA